MGGTISTYQPFLLGDGVHGILTFGRVGPIDSINSFTNDIYLLIFSINLQMGHRDQNGKNCLVLIICILGNSG